MCAKFGCGPTVVSKKGGVKVRQTKGRTALYSRLEFGGNHNILMKEVFYFSSKNKTNVLDIQLQITNELVRWVRTNLKYTL